MEAEVFITLPGDDGDKVISILSQEFTIKPIGIGNSSFECFDSDSIGSVIGMAVTSKFRNRDKFNTHLLKILNDNGISYVSVVSVIVNNSTLHYNWSSSNIKKDTIIEKKLCEAIDILEKENKELKEKTFVKIKWSGIYKPNDDLTTRRPAGRYDVINAVDGWVVRDPFNNRWVYNDTQWYTTFNRPSGMTSREEARLFAESLIRKNEGL